jgi:hypothetical protein
MTGERWMAVGILAVLLAGGALFVKDQLDFCGPRCTTAIEDTEDLNRLARQQGISRLAVPPCEGTGAALASERWAAPGAVTALTTLPDGALLAAGSDGLLWTATPAVDGARPDFVPWAPGGHPVGLGRQVTALANTGDGHVLVAAGAPSRVLVVDTASGHVRAELPVPGGSPVHALGGAPGRVLAVDTAGAAWDAVAESREQGTWTELRELKGSGELPQAQDVDVYRSEDGAALVGVVSTPETLRWLNVRNGQSRVVSADGPGADRPMTAESAALVTAAAVAQVDGRWVLVDDGRVRPASARADLQGFGVGVASPVEGLETPTAAVAFGGRLVVATGGTELVVVDAPTC